VINKTFKKIAVGAAALLTLGSATLASTSADAYPHGGGWRGGWGPGAAIGAGIFGLAIGASLARPDYGPGPGYYGRPYGYYGRPYGYYGGCRAYWRWSPHWGRYVRASTCG
jgi:hypothetical protein